MRRRATRGACCERCLAGVTVGPRAPRGAAMKQPAAVPLPGPFGRNSQLVNLTIGARPPIGVGRGPGRGEPGQLAGGTPVHRRQHAVPARRRVGDGIPPAVPPDLLGLLAGQLGQQLRRHDPGEPAPPGRDLHAGQASGVTRAGGPHEARGRIRRLAHVSGSAVSIMMFSFVVVRISPSTLSAGRSPGHRRAGRFSGRAIG